MILQLVEEGKLSFTDTLDKFYWEYATSDNVNFAAIFRFHGESFLALLKSSLSKLQWQFRESFWGTHVFKRSQAILASGNKTLIEGLFEIFYEFPSTALLSSDIEIAPDVADKYKSLTRVAEIAALAGDSSFSFLFTYLTTHEKLNGPNQLYLPLASSLWKHLLSRKNLKPAEARRLCDHIVQKVGAFSTSSSSEIMTLEALQRDFWSMIFAPPIKSTLNVWPNKVVKSVEDKLDDWLFPSKA